MSNSKLSRTAYQIIGLLSLLFFLVLSFFFLAALFFAVWKGLVFTFSSMATLDKQVVTAIIAAVSTVLISVLSVLFAKSIENKRLIEKDIRDKKIPVYEDFLSYFFLYTSGKQDKTMEDFFNDFSPKLLIYGSDEVIKSWDEFKQVSVSEDEYNTALAFEKLMFVIRKDIGHHNKDLKEGILLRLFIKDLEEYKKQRKQAALK